MDLFPRILYRETPKMFIGDLMAKEIAVRALHANRFAKVPRDFRILPCLVLSHQEDLEMQKLCRAEWRTVSPLFAHEAHGPKLTKKLNE
jgi:uncharacterized protein (DUF924 family)